MVGQAGTVAKAVEDPVVSRQGQATTVFDVASAVTRLAGSDTAPDGDGPVDADQAAEGQAGDDVSLPEDLPDGIPDFVIGMLTEEQLRGVARGNLDPSDVM